MRTAIVCDWLVTYAGAERVLEQILQCYPDADLFAVIDFLPQGQRDFIMNKPVTTTCIQRSSLARVCTRRTCSACRLLSNSSTFRGMTLSSPVPMP